MILDRHDKALDAVSTDTSGPISPVDYDGNAYLQLIVDAATGHTQGFPLKKKSEAATAILKGIRRLELAVGKTVKRYHSDNAKEKRTKSLLNELEAKGTKVSSTSPHSSQQNALVEQRFQTIFAATRAALSASGLPKKFWSIACLDAIDKGNFLPIKRSSGHTASPNACIPGEPHSAKHLLPFGQSGYIVDTTPHKKKLEDRALRARYVRSISETQYLVLLPDSGKTRLIRNCEFLLEKQNILNQNKTPTTISKVSSSKDLVSQQKLQIQSQMAHETFPNLKGQFKNQIRNTAEKTYQG